MQEFDVLVVGGGASGLRAAIAAKRAGASVALVTKVHPLRTNSAIAHGGLNAPLGRDDSADIFAQDTIRAGGDLCDTNVVRILAGEAPKDVIWLERMGVPFNRDKEGRLDRRRLGSNSRSRTCYADDQTGHIVLQVLHEQFQREQIPAFEEWFVTSLAVDGGTCCGAIALSFRDGKLDAFASRAVILATGGLTRLYRPATASIGTSGDGQALAYKAGARLMDMEMIQYHPTVFSGSQPLLITEASLGEGAVLVDGKGQSIDSMGIPRDRLCRSINDSMQNAGGSVYLDLRPIGRENLLSRFPQTHELVRVIAGMDITKEPVPIRPVAHRPMGGIETDATGRTSIGGLFAVGECACNGLNGAGRLTGNTLTEAVVFGRIVGDAAAAYAKGAARKGLPAGKLAEGEKQLTGISSGGSSGDSSGRIHSELGELMNGKVGLVRTGTELQEARDRIQSLNGRYTKLRVQNRSKVYNYELTAHLELGSMLKLAEAVTLAAQGRTESRGAHRRADFPERDDANWQQHTVVHLVDGSPKLEKKPVAGTA